MADYAMSFEDSLRESEELLYELEEDGQKAEHIQKLETFLSATPSCRAFFVNLLTGESVLADDPPEFLLNALRKSEEVPELLAKNLVMSTATMLSHKRAGNTAKAEGSDKVACRTARLIRLMKSEQNRTKLIEMRSSIKMKAGVYAEFLRRWEYDQEQLETAAKAIEDVLV